jgi:hypothetical protein
MSGSENLIENQRTTALLRESEEHYRAVTEAVTDSIITIDSYSYILRSIRSVTPPEEMIGNKAEWLFLRSRLGK